MASLQSLAAETQIQEGTTGEVSAATEGRLCSDNSNTVTRVAHLTYVHHTLG